ncbi:MAG TPA: hypothetical protein VIZ21_07725 [Ignavibacteriaceae bacterium]
MSGKATFILILGFTLIFLVMGYFWGSLATRSVDNHVSYYKTTVAHNIAVSGANIALQEVIADSEWVSDINDRPFEYGLMNVDLTSLGPPERVLTSTGTFGGVDQIVKVKLLRDQTSLAKYAWFIPSVSTGSVTQRPWITGDSIWGGFHSNQFLVVDGDPVFFGKVTTLKGIKDMGSGSNPVFLGGYEEGIEVNWVSEMHYPNYAAIAGAGSTFNRDLWLKFNSDGTVTYRVRTGSGGSNPGQDSTLYTAPNTVPVTTLAPNGVIYVDRKNVYLSGTLNGNVTIVAEGSSGGGSGNVYFTGDMVYNIDPMIPNGAGGYMINPASLDADGKPRDVLGIVTTNNVLVSTSGNLGGYQNNVLNQDIHIDAGIFCNSGGFKVEGLGSAPANVPLGSIYLQGSMTAGKEEVVAQFSGNTLIAGYNRHVIFDERFAIGPPTWFPYLTYYRVTSWLE